MKGFSAKDLRMSMKRTRAVRGAGPAAKPFKDVAVVSRLSKPERDLKNASVWPYPQDVQGRLARLPEVASYLKAKFVGIDHVIDSIITKVTYWYLYPERATRPLVVNLWGMTGVGKTDLVRSMRDLLGFSSMYLEITMSDHSGDDTVLGEVSSGCSRLSSGQPGILVADEFQRFRTKDGEGDPVRGLSYKDLWQILSDGILVNHCSYSAIYRLMGTLKWSPSSGFTAKKGKESVSDVDEYSDEKILEGPGSADMVESLLGFPLGSSADPLKVGLPRDVDALVYAGQKLMTLDKVLTDQGVVHERNVHGILSGIYKVMVSELGSDHLAIKDDFTKALIFIIGNLDDLYQGAIGAVSPFIPANYVREKSYNITVPEVKSELGKLFFPEQVARLGNVHITYPALGDEHYAEIARRIIESVANGLRQQYPGLVVDKSVEDLVVRNGVYPTQGVRPLMTTAGDVLSEAVTLLTQVHPEGYSGGPLTLAYDTVGAKLTIKSSVSSKKTVSGSLPFEGDKDRILRKVRESVGYLETISVHESGHALMSYATSGVLPERVLVLDGHAFNIFPSNYHTTFGLTISRIMMSLAGVAAVKSVFGLQRVDSGHALDLQGATDSVVELIRQQGLARELATRFSIKELPASIPAASSYTHVTDSRSKRTSLVLSDMTAEAAFVDAVLVQAGKEVEHILKKHDKALKVLAYHLSSELFLDHNTIKKILDKGGVKPDTTGVALIRGVSFGEGSDSSSRGQDS